MAARADWKEKQSSLTPGRLFYLDETSVKTNMAREYGRAPRGLRASYNCGTKCHVPALEEGVETAETPSDGFRAGWLVAA